MNSVISAQLGKLPEFSKGVLPSCTILVPSVKLIHHTAIKQHSWDDFTRSEVLFPSVTSRNQRAREDMQSEWLFIITLLWQLGQHILSLKYMLWFKSAFSSCYKIHWVTITIYIRKTNSQFINSYTMKTTNLFITHFIYAIQFLLPTKIQRLIHAKPVTENGWILVWGIIFPNSEAL